MSLEHESHPFDEMICDGQSEFRLAHAALLWARDEYTNVAPAHYLERLGVLADRVDRAGAHTGNERIDAISQVLVKDEAFRGNYGDFVNPANSYLNCVIDTRRGIPISLSAIWLDIAEQLDWPLSGVSLPGHFIIRYDGVGEEILVDPFNEGRELNHEDCERIVKAVCGADTMFGEEHLAPADPRSILARMLGNLYATYTRLSDWPRTIHILKRFAALQPGDAMILAELGRMQTLVGQLKRAADTLNRAGELAQDDEQRSTVNHHLASLRSHLSEQN